MCGHGRLLVPLAASRLQDPRRRSVRGDARPLRGQAGRRRIDRPDLPAGHRPDEPALSLRLRVRGGRLLPADHRPAASAAALERIRAHLVDPGILYVECRIPSAASQRLGAPLVEVRTVKIDDETQIALRSETTWWADARLARAENRYAHRRGAQRLAEEHETVTTTWYAPDEFAELVRAAGFREVTTGPAPTDGRGRRGVYANARRIA